MSSGNGSSAEDVDATLQRGPEGGSRRIRLLSYNTFLRPPPVGSSTDYKDARSKKMVEETIADFDIVCLQELFGSYTSRREKFIANAKLLIELTPFGIAEQISLLSNHTGPPHRSST